MCDIIGRSVVIRTEEDLGEDYVESASGILACGTIGTTFVNPDLVSLPMDATSDGNAFDGPGTDLCYTPAVVVPPV